MPMLSNIGLRKKIAETGLVQIGSNLINKQLLEELKKNRDKESFVAISNGVYFTQKTTKEILNILVDGAFEDGDATTEQRTQKLQEIHDRVKSLTKKDTLSLSEADELYTTSIDISRYFGGFKLGDAKDNHYLQEVGAEDYKILENNAISIHKDINTYITAQDAIVGQKSVEQREEEILDFEKFVKQFAELQDKKQVTPEIQMQYDSYMGWVERYFPGVYGLPQMIGTNYFPNIDTEQYEQREDEVTEAYDTLIIKYNRLVSTIED